MRDLLIVSLISLTILFYACNGFAFSPVSHGSAAVLSSTGLKMTLLNYKGKKVEVKEGTPLSQACVKLGIKPTYSCKKGDCATCTITVGSYCLKACVDKVPPMPKLKSLQENGLKVQ